MVHLHISREDPTGLLFPCFLQRLQKADFFLLVFIVERGVGIVVHKSLGSQKGERRRVYYIPSIIYTYVYILYYASIKLGSRLFCYNIFVDVGAIFPARAAPL